jgi:hypothetical protein
MIRIEETYHRVPLPPTADDLRTKRLYGWEPRQRYDRKAAGELALRIDAHSWDVPRVRKSWSDGKSQRVEDQLNDFVVGLVRAAEVKKRVDQERAEQRRLREEERGREEDRRRRAEEEHARRTELKRQATAWLEHQGLRQYVAALRVAAEDQGLLGKGNEFETWVGWAERYVQEADPMHHLDELPNVHSPTQGWYSSRNSRAHQ